MSWVFCRVRKATTDSLRWFNDYDVRALVRESPSEMQRRNSAGGAAADDCDPDWAGHMAPMINLVTQRWMPRYYEDDG
jgi:hypothetical protein